MYLSFFILSFSENDAFISLKAQTKIWIHALQPGFFYKQASGSGEDEYRMQGAYDDDNDDNADGGQLAQFDNKTSAQVT